MIRSNLLCTSPNSEPSIIDLVFISNVHLFEFCNIIPQLANSDHFGLHVCIKHTSDTTQYTPTTRRKIWRYKHADFNRANDLLIDVDLDSIINPYDIQSTWSNWKEIFLDIMNAYLHLFCPTERIFHGSPRT